MSEVEAWRMRAAIDDYKRNVTEWQRLNGLADLYGISKDVFTKIEKSKSILDGCGDSWGFPGKDKETMKELIKVECSFWYYSAHSHRIIDMIIAVMSLFDKAKAAFIEKMEDDFLEKANNGAKDE